MSRGRPKRRKLRRRRRSGLRKWCRGKGANGSFGSRISVCRMLARMEGVGRVLASGMAFQLRIGRGDRLRSLQGWNNNKPWRMVFFCVCIINVSVQFSGLTSWRRLNGSPAKPNLVTCTCPYVYKITQQQKHHQIIWPDFFSFPFFQCNLISVEGEILATSEPVFVLYRLGHH